jgi:hypothetical protein
MGFKAHRRTDHSVRLTAEHIRGRSASRALAHASHTRRPDRTGLQDDPRATRSRGPATAAVGERSSVARGALASGPLFARWTKNEAGRLVMTWSPAPEVEAAPAISLLARGRAAAAGLPVRGGRGRGQ